VEKMIVFKSIKINGKSFIWWLVAIIAIVFGLYFGLR